ncbi:MAG: hypothetical protein LC102_02965 [Ignavibacteriales bacterium]|jgi:hypothetical protein|nr:MAG: hypothetical protein F9K26_06475 [Ignavibacteriaceae bacterium]MBW7872996.1 hypothetical protein [Ignavibacteria bacterium]MCZ2142375.1 hypothetical protein [Ignavibacteriales bacterium]OQY72160.1 MAG: hypothetical protein B6D45_09340 [Ignavibacteriales bacterium UTCHB3]MBV6445258.1 hypothetical protein [Ignavibacteriaceae bacterium]
MMTSEKQFYNWTIDSGDYYRQNSDYDKLYAAGKKKEKIIRNLLWGGSAVIATVVFFFLLSIVGYK